MNQMKTRRDSNVQSSSPFFRKSQLIEIGGQMPQIRIKYLNTVVKKKDDNKAREEIWNKRIMESKSYDSQIIIKKNQISPFMLVVMFLIIFCILFHLVPMQAYHPNLE